MTLPPVIRIFFAIEMPSPIKESINDFIHTLKKRAKSNAVRWTKPENLHITLQFLAEVNTNHLNDLIKAVRDHIENQSLSTSIKFGAPHLFPNPYRPRVIVLQISAEKALARLADLIGQGIKNSHYEIDSRPFRAHLTLGRIKQPQGLNLNFLSEFHSPILDEMTVNEIVLFRSEPDNNGSRYTVIERLKLGEPIHL